MTVKLISYSQGEKDESLQDIIAYTARVSNPSNQDNTETSERLLRYLIREKHWSPFEMVSACLEVTTTRDIARQLLRHRSFSFQEFSQRYADPTKDLKFEFNCQYDEKDSIGKRYRRQDAIGTPFCITVDHQTPEDNTVTIRYRDTMDQERVSISDLKSIIGEKVSYRQILED